MGTGEYCDGSSEMSMPRGLPQSASKLAASSLEREPQLPRLYAQPGSPRHEGAEGQLHAKAQAPRVRTTQEQVSSPREPPAGAARLSP